MLPQVDSLTRAISNADTTIKFAMIVLCRIHVSRNKENREQIIYYFLDEHMTIQNSYRIDSAIALLARGMN
jgi:hypothetical protein